MKLFSENLGSAKSDAELEVLKQKFAKYDSAYVCQSTGTSRIEIKKWMEDLWQMYEPFADRQFLNAFKLQFSQRSWELYLATTFIKNGFKLGRHKDHEPDIDLREAGGGKRIAWIEAISVKKGDGTDRVPDVQYNGVFDVPEEEMILRISNALAVKFEQYEDRLKKKVVQEDEPYIIAINRSELEHVEGFTALIIKALFGLGHQALRVMVDEKRQENPKPFWTARPHIAKTNQSSVSTLFFLNPKHAGISAAIYCIDNMPTSSRYKESMGENFIIIHNPLAKNPLPREIFSFGEEWEIQGNDLVKIKKSKIEII